MSDSVRPSSCSTNRRTKPPIKKRKLHQQEYHDVELDDHVNDNDKQGRMKDGASVTVAADAASSPYGSTTSSTSSVASFSSPGTTRSDCSYSIMEETHNDDEEEVNDGHGKNKNPVRNSFALPPPMVLSMVADASQSQGGTMGDTAGGWLSTQPPILTSGDNMTTSPSIVVVNTSATAFSSEEGGQQQQQQQPTKKKKKRKVSLSPDQTCTSTTTNHRNRVGLDNNKNNDGDSLGKIALWTSPRRRPQQQQPSPPPQKASKSSTSAATTATAMVVPGTTNARPETPTISIKVKTKKTASKKKEPHVDDDDAEEVIILMEDEEQPTTTTNNKKKKDGVPKMGTQDGMEKDILPSYVTDVVEITPHNSRTKTETTTDTNTTNGTVDKSDICVTVQSSKSIANGSNGPEEEQSPNLASTRTTTPTLLTASKLSTAIAADNSKSKSVPSKTTTKATSDGNQKVTPTTPAAAAAHDDKTSKIKKKKKRTFQDELLHKLFVTCRPYTIKELMQLMDNASEATIQFCLLSLVDKQWVFKKEFGGGAGGSSTKSNGRTKELYWANQECTSKDLWENHLDFFVPIEEIHTARKELGTLQHEYKTLQQDLQQALHHPSNIDLEIQCQMGEREVMALQEHIVAAKGRIAAEERQCGGSNHHHQQHGGGGSIKFGSVQPKSTTTMTRSSPTQMKKGINRMREEWVKRRILVMDFMEQLADGMEKKVKDMFKIIEIETDESVGVTIPSKHVV